MLTEYIQAAMRRATYKVLEDDGTYVGKIPGLQGIWANAETIEACRKELQEVLEDWMLFRLSRRLSLPIIDGINFNLKETA